MTISTNNTVSMYSLVNNISKDIVSQKDTDTDSALSLEELEIDEDVFNSFDSDSDGLITQNEIASAIDSKLSEFSEMPTKEEFSSLISELGLQMPLPPSSQADENTNNILASDLISNYDTDGDSLLSTEEVSILNEDEFNSLDTDSSGSISEEELSSAIDEVSESEVSSSTPPSGGGGMPMTSSEEEEEEYFSQWDTNEDGIISQAEKAEKDATLGINQEDDMKESIKTLLDTIKLNASENNENLDLSSFKNVMKMMNNQSNNELNTYVNNLSNNNTSTIHYA